MQVVGKKQLKMVNAFTLFNARETTATSCTKCG